MTNFGVEPFLDKFVDLAPPPAPRVASTGSIEPTAPEFSGFVFKIQANMDPRHRDRIAFVRICSGKFTRGMEVAARAHRQAVRDDPHRAVPGAGADAGRRGLRRATSWACGTAACCASATRWSRRQAVRVPGRAALLARALRACAALKDPLKRKQLKKGLEQLSEEGAVQLFFDRHRLSRDPILGAVGVLQFEVIQHRLQAEYGVAVSLQPLPYRHARWVTGEPFDPNKFERPGRTTCVLDVEDRPLILFDTDWALRDAVADQPAI